jgi:hypothetical protein
MRIRVNVRKGKGQDGHDCGADEQNRKTVADGCVVWHKDSDERSGFRLGRDGNGEAHALRGVFDGRGIASGLLQPKASGSVMHLVEFDADVSPTCILCCEERGARTAEWV